MEPPPKIFAVINNQRKHAIDNGKLRHFLKSLIPELGIGRREFSVVLITDDKIRQLNRDYRGFDKPTDVLSFRGDGEYLGDILISSETAYNQSRKSSTLSFESNLHRLVLHGLLHLMGYDHETDNGEMRTIERRLRRRFQC
jgi:probable rRNA maturation factor